MVIFFARVCDVTLGTLRIIFVSRGKRNLAPLFGFFEVLIWIVIIGQLVQHLHSVTAYIGYAAGFAAGNFVGIWLEDRLALGTYVIRIIASENGASLIHSLHTAGFGVTRLDGHGSAGPVSVIYTIVRRRNVDQALGIIRKTAPEAFITIEETRSTEKGFFPPPGKSQDIFLFGRKAK